MKKTALLVFDGFADWEPAYAVTGLRRWGKREVVTVGYSMEPVTSMGGLRVIPDCALQFLSPDDTEMLIVPGGDQWLETRPQQNVEGLLTMFAARSIPIAGICAGTTALARAGLFRGRRHTSNGRAFLESYVPGYESQDLYVETLAVRDKGVISANGLGAIEFAREIFAELQVFGEAELRLFEDMYRHGSGPSDR